MGELYRIVQDHLDRYGVREAEFARRIGTGPQTVNNWKNRGVRKLPDRRLLEAVAEVTGASYSQVLAAALIDSGYQHHYLDSMWATFYGITVADHDQLESVVGTLEAMAQDARQKLNASYQEQLAKYLDNEEAHHEDQDTQDPPSNSPADGEARTSGTPMSEPHGGHSGVGVAKDPLWQEYDDTKSQSPQEM